MRVTINNEWIGRLLDIDGPIPEFFEKNKKEFFKKMNTTRIQGHFKVDATNTIVAYDGESLKKSRIAESSQVSNGNFYLFLTMTFEISCNFVNCSLMPFSLYRSPLHYQSEELLNLPK